MIQFRIMDFVSALFYRFLGRVLGVFGSYGRGARIERPLHIAGPEFMHFEENAFVQNGAYLTAVHLHEAPPILRFGRDSLVGHHVHIVCTRLVEIGEGALIADRVFIADNGHEFEDPDRPIKDQGLRQLRDTRIGRGCWVGNNAVILGCSIGENSVVAANSVVTKDVPDRCVVAGAPARIVRRWSQADRKWIAHRG